MHRRLKLDLKLWRLARRRPARPLASAAHGLLLIGVVGVLLSLLEPVDEGLGGVAHLLARLLEVRVEVGVRVGPGRVACSGEGEGWGEGEAVEGGAPSSCCPSRAT